MSDTMQGLELLIAAEFIDDVEIANFDSLRSHDDTTIGTALEVASAFDSTIVLASRFVQSYADPSSDTRNLRHCANELHSSTTLD